MMKNIKRLKLKIASLICLVAILTLEFSPLSVKATANQLQFNTKVVESVGRDTYNGKNVWYSMATLGGNVAYCIDYTCPAPSGVMTLREKMSDQGLAILLHGYPNSTPAQMGLDTNEEAYMATQMALWEVMNRTGESHKAGLKFKVENVAPIAGKEAFWNKTVPAAQRLVSIAETDPYTNHPTLTIDATNAKLGSIDGDALIGPYTTTVTGIYDASCLKSITASLTNAPASARIVDANGNDKTSIENGGSVYVRMSTSENNCSFKINFAADCDKKVGLIYTTSGYVQDYVMIDTEPAPMGDSVDINWKKVSTVGQIELTKVDQDDLPIKGVEFSLQKEDGTELLKVKTGTDGKITFTDVPEGNYKLVEVGTPEGYVVKEATSNVTVVRGETAQVKVVNERITGKLVITKIDDFNRPLKDVTFEIYSEKDGKTYLEASVVTDEQGKASVEVPYGTYYFKEVSAPEGYIMDQQLYKFSVDAENRTFYKTITNVVYKGSIIITKVDDKNQPIGGVVFEITDAQGNVVNTLTTGAKSGKCGLQNLPAGTYYYQEKSVPEGYIMDTEKHEFKLTKNEEVIERTVVNYKEDVLGHVEIIKVDSEGKPVKGVEFNILDANKKVVDTLTTDGTGFAKSKDLPLGTYYYVETKAPAYVKMDTTEHAFVLTDNVRVVKKTVMNELVGGSLTIIKVDENNEPLQGVKFNILDENKKVIDTMVTDEKGVANSNIELHKNTTYYYQEIEAPEGIVVDNTQYEFKVEYDGQNVVANMVNYYAKGVLQITKLVEGKETPLANVKFQIVNEAREVIDTIVTDENGFAESKKLPLGTYYFKEVEAPEGYIMDNNEHEFKIVANNDVITAVVYNKEEELPKTGGAMSSDMMIILLVSLVGVLGYAGKRALEVRA